MVSDAGEVTLLPERVRRKGVQFEKGAHTPATNVDTPAGSDDRYLLRENGLAVFCRRRWDL